MIEVRQTALFAAWLRDLRDLKARVRIAVRIERLQEGNFGDAKSVGQGVSDLRIDYGPGYRVYYVRRGSTAVVLLCGGDKQTQDRDVARALKLAKEV
ncbi:MAG TPA: type II toxin-antitoxin system RelE/ParE family toxin [Salinarimonas sp.]|jgi:putative addiction module killer protein|nr:type II toxin-antitoxin system RelE/ParE family toxin [Salinarimonas sp.]